MSVSNRMVAQLSTETFHNKQQTETKEAERSFGSTNTNYNLWKQGALHKRHKSVAKPSPAPIKTGLEIEKTLDMLSEHSPDFKNKQFNNYDNTVRHLPRKVVENYHLQHNFSRKPSFTNIKNKPSLVSLGHAVGPGGRAILYGAMPKSPYERSAGTMNRNDSESRALLRETHSESMNKWNNYDSSIRNEIELQRKFIDKKNYELDSRAQAL